MLKAESINADAGAFYNLVMLKFIIAKKFGGF